MRALPTVLAFLAAVPLLAGCMGSDGNDPVTDSGPLLDAKGPAGCDGPVFSSRVRAREIDVAADLSDRSRLAAAMMVSIPSTRAAAPRDPAVWSGIARSGDAGATWTTADLSGWPGDPGIAASPFAGTAVLGDPIVRFLPDGTLLVIGLAIRGGAWIDVYAARFDGESLTPSTVATISRGGYGDPRLSPVPGPYQVFYNDKPEVGVDPATGAVYVGWMMRTNRPDAGSLSIPAVALSTDGGRSWDGPRTLVGGLAASATSEGLQGGAMPFVTSDGTAHVMWWDQPGAAYQQADAPSGTLDFGAPRRVLDVDGSFGGAGSTLAISVPHVAVGAGPGGAGERAYVTWVEQMEGRGHDIWLSHSDDGAKTWSERVRVNQDSTANHQVLPAVAVSPQGVVGVSFIDKRDDPANSDYHAYVAVSRDGETFEEGRMTAVASVEANVADGLQPIGDYYGIAYGADGFVALWEDGREGTADVPYGTAYRCVVPLHD
ncbi:MAG TPA: sialidase family protein [Candidatus Thermoplasmatota archaeon]|nr:sialidase family protein [Candidatus Thermoplasmatota archaeon]